MWKMLTIMIPDAARANEPNISTEIINMDIHFVTAAHSVQLEFYLVYI